jgi:hypothetical protein
LTISSSNLVCYVVHSVRGTMVMVTARSNLVGNAARDPGGIG